MKYNPEEMLAYLQEHEMYEDFVTASVHNKRGFAHVHVPGKITFKDNMPLFYHQTADNEWDTVALDPHLFSAKDFAAVIKDPTHIYAEVININGKCHITMACHEKNKQRKEAEISVLHDVLIQFIEFAGIDTPGKAKAVIKESAEVFQTFKDTSGFQPVPDKKK